MKSRVITSGIILVEYYSYLLAGWGNNFLQGQTGAVEDCNDDNQGNHIFEGKLRVIGAVKGLCKSVGSRNSKRGSGSLFGIKFKIDFHCREQKNWAKNDG